MRVGSGLAVKKVRLESGRFPIYELAKRLPVALRYDKEIIMATEGGRSGPDSWFLRHLGVLLILGAILTGLLTLGAFLLPHWAVAVGSYRGANRLAAQDAIRADGLIRPGSDGGPGYWIPTNCWSVCWAA
jgi:hypothetical protein